MVKAEPHLSLISQIESPNNPTLQNDQGNCGQIHLSSNKSDDSVCIIDFGAIDHMTFDSNDFSHITLPRRNRIANVNGVTYLVIKVGTVTLSPSLSLSHTLLVPSLPNKLMSVNQVTANLNCVVLIYPNFYLFQDIFTKKIIGRGTKREGLYYMDDFNLGKVNHMHHTTSDKEK